MKLQPTQDGKRSPEDQFKALGRKIMSVPKAEVDARDKAWHASKRKSQRHKA
jgi:hypothetical protein